LQQEGLCFFLLESLIQNQEGNQVLQGSLTQKVSFHEKYVILFTFESIVISIEEMGG
jgi:hypothetical protein